MEDRGKQQNQIPRDPSLGERVDPLQDYQSSIEKMSEKWRSIRKEDRQADSRGFLERHFLVVGIGIALLIFALLAVFGGFAFLIWNAR